VGDGAALARTQSLPCSSCVEVGHVSRFRSVMDAMGMLVRIRILPSSPRQLTWTAWTILETTRPACRNRIARTVGIAHEIHTESQHKRCTAHDAHPDAGVPCLRAQRGRLPVRPAPLGGPLRHLRDVRRIGAVRAAVGVRPLAVVALHGPPPEQQQSALRGRCSGPDML